MTAPAATPASEQTLRERLEALAHELSKHCGCEGRMSAHCPACKDRFLAALRTAHEMGKTDGANEERSINGFHERKAAHEAGRRAGLAEAAAMALKHADDFSRHPGMPQDVLRKLAAALERAGGAGT